MEIELNRVSIKKYFLNTASACSLASACLYIKGVLLTGRATSVVGIVAGVSLTVFSIILVRRIEDICNHQVYNRSIEELRTTRGSPLKEIGKALSAIGTLGLKGKFFTTLRAKANQFSSRLFFSAVCLSVIFLSTYSAGKGLLFTAAAFSKSSPIISIVSSLSLPLITGGIVLLGLGSTAAFFSPEGVVQRWRSLSQSVDQEEVHRTKLSAIISQVMQIGIVALGFGVFFTAIASSPSATLSFIVARVALAVGGFMLTIGSARLLNNVFNLVNRACENVANIYSIDQAIEEIYMSMWPERAVPLPALPPR